MEPNGFDKNMAAVTFAEAGEHETANHLMASAAQEQAGMVKIAKKKPVLSMVVFGAISLTGYVLLIENQGWVTETFTKGGIYTMWPIGTALAFSFIHGAFASNFLSVLGLEAKKH
ncbi:MAG: hypothetical protein OEM01_07405 [Desulfobulbaceae bacterium]|nr:hypothetical protein [Desulfobulbaceae bacterium]